MAIWPFILGCLGLIATGRALVLGAASAGGDGISRDGEPMLYWLCVIAGISVTGLLFYMAWRG